MTDWNLSRWYPWSQPAVPLYLMPTFTPCFGPLREQAGIGYFQSVLTFVDGQGIWAFRPGDAVSLGNRMIDFLLVPAHRVTFEEQLLEARNALIERYQEVEAADLANADNPDLVAIAERLFAAIYRYYTFGSYVEPIQMAGEALLKDEVSRAAMHTRWSEDLGAATAGFFSGGYELYTTVMLRDRLSIARELAEATAEDISVLSWPTSGDRAAWATDMAALLPHRFATVHAKVEKYCRDFHWSRNNYQRCVSLTPADVLVEIVGSSASLNEALAGMASQLETAAANRHQSTSIRSDVAAHLSPYSVAVTALYDTIGIELSDERKQTVLRGLACVTRVVDAIARRSNATVDLLLYLFPEEIGDFLSKGRRRYEARLDLRRQATLVYQGDFTVLDESAQPLAEHAFQPMDGPAVFEGKRAVDENLQRLATRLDLLQDAPPSVIRGTVSYARSPSDVITGVARVVRDPLTDGFSPGEILVATSTTPDFVSLMQRALAIVTDWGGQSSHAALTSRELGIPCITGTAFASTAIKSGETVTIDFSTGIVEPRG